MKIGRNGWCAGDAMYYENTRCTTGHSARFTYGKCEKISLYILTATLFIFLSRTTWTWIITADLLFLYNGTGLFLLTV